MNHDPGARRERAGVFYSHPASLEHDPSAFSPGHPDTPARIAAIERALGEREWPRWERREAPAAGHEQLELIHTAAHVRSLERLCAAGGGPIDLDTAVGPRSFEAALHAAGGACAMARALLDGDAAVGFCALRPSGHHAEADRAMGFCLFNNVAIAAELAIRELGARRVLVLDWDVHHGNGTAEAFRSRADVLFVSIHQMPLYPGSGPLGDTGSGAGEGYTLNLPVPAGSEESLWLSLIEHLVAPAARAFEPELVLVSAGFDGHARDPLASCRLQTGSFARIARAVRALAGGAPVGAVLEGGYEPAVLGDCVVAALTGFEDDGEPPRDVPLLAPVAAAARQLGRYWPLPAAGGS